MALVYGVLGLVVILTAGTFGTINSSPWFNLGIAVLFVVLGARDVRRPHDRLLALLERQPRHGDRAAARFVLAFSMGAVAALLAGACVAPVVIQVVLFSSNLYATGTTRRAGAAVLSSASAWRFRGRSPAPASRRCRSRARGWSASSRRSASSSWRRRPTTATRRTRSSRTAGSIPPRSRRASQEQLKAGWHASLAEGLDRREARAEAGAHRHVGDLVQELPDDGQDDARRTRT